MHGLNKNLSKKTAEKYGDLIDRVESAKLNELPSILIELIERSPHSYQSLLRGAYFADLFNYVVSKTGFLPVDSRLSTRCWYVVNGLSEVIRCHNCGKPITRDIQITENPGAFWCCRKCQGED